MSDRKFTLEPGDMQRLKALLNEEEERLDAADLDDAELAQLEQALEERLRTLAAGASPATGDAEGLERNWHAIQNSIPTGDTGEPRQELGTVLPFRPKKKRSFVWVGALLAAALALLVVLPRGQEEDLSIAPPMVEKGQPPLYQTDCEIDIRSLDGTSSVRLSQQQGFEGPAGTPVSLRIRCTRDGFLQVLAGAQALVQNLPLRAREAKELPMDRQLTIPDLASRVVTVAVTDQLLSEQETRTLQEGRSQQLPGKAILWLDTVVLKREQP